MNFVLLRDGGDTVDASSGSFFLFVIVAWRYAFRRFENNEKCCWQRAENRRGAFGVHTEIVRAHTQMRLFLVERFLSSNHYYHVLP